MESFARQIAPKIEGFLHQTARSLERSFANYWPSDAQGNNDPCEQNVAFHFGHILLCHDFSVFAEANHPHESHGRIDQLAIAPERDWFLGAEFKKVWTGTHEAIVWDQKRLADFRLTSLDPNIFGQRRIESVESCTNGVGLVAGLMWVPASGRSMVLDFWKSKGQAGTFTNAKRIRESVLKHNCYWPEPMRAWDSYDGSTYYLLALMFDIPSSNPH